MLAFEKDGLNVNAQPWAGPRRGEGGPGPSPPGPSAPAGPGVVSPVTSSAGPGPSASGDAPFAMTGGGRGNINGGQPGSSTSVSPAPDGPAWSRDGGGAPSRPAVVASPGTRGRDRPLCKFHASGGCTRGDDCPFSHDLTVEAPDDGAAEAGFVLNTGVTNAERAQPHSSAPPPGHPIHGGQGAVPGHNGPPAGSSGSGNYFHHRDNSAPSWQHGHHGHHHSSGGPHGSGQVLFSGDGGWQHGSPHGGSHPHSGGQAPPDMLFHGMEDRHGGHAPHGHGHSHGHGHGGHSAPPSMNHGPHDLVFPDPHGPSHGGPPPLEEGVFSRASTAGGYVHPVGSSTPPGGPTAFPSGGNSTGTGGAVIFREGTTIFGGASTGQTHAAATASNASTAATPPVGAQPAPERPAADEHAAMLDGWKPGGDAPASFAEVGAALAGALTFDNFGADHGDSPGALHESLHAGTDVHEPGATLAAVRNGDPSTDATGRAATSSPASAPRAEAEAAPAPAPSGRPKPPAAAAGPSPAVESDTATSTDPPAAAIPTAPDAPDGPAAPAGPAGPTAPAVEPRRGWGVGPAPAAMHNADLFPALPGAEAAGAAQRGKGRAAPAKAPSPTSPTQAPAPKAASSAPDRLADLADSPTQPTPVATATGAKAKQRGTAPATPIATVGAALAASGAPQSRIRETPAPAVEAKAKGAAAPAAAAATHGGRAPAAAPAVGRPGSGWGAAKGAPQRAAQPAARLPPGASPVVMKGGKTVAVPLPPPSAPPKPKPKETPKMTVGLRSQQQQAAAQQAAAQNGRAKRKK